MDKEDSLETKLILQKLRKEENTSYCELKENLNQLFAKTIKYV